jgi:predicted O-methyltransferase YrrM
MISPAVATAIDELEAFQESRSDSYNIPRQEGMILHAFVVAAGCRYLVEVGTSYGFSGLFLASAAKGNGGLLHSFDRDAHKHEHATKNFQRAGLSDAVKLYTGDALVELSRLREGIDFAFLDATKSQTFAYWKLLETRFSRRCIVAVDNTRTHRKELMPFVEMLRGRGDFTCCDVPVGNGFELAVRAG